MDPIEALESGLSAASPADEVYQEESAAGSSRPSVAEVSVQGAGQAPPEGAQVGGRSSGDSRVDDAESVAAARSAALPPDIAFQGAAGPWDVRTGQTAARHAGRTMPVGAQAGKYSGSAAPIQPAAGSMALGFGASKTAHGGRAKALASLQQAGNVIRRGVQTVKQPFERLGGRPALRSGGPASPGGVVPSGDSRDLENCSLTFQEGGGDNDSFGHSPSATRRRIFGQCGGGMAAPDASSPPLMLPLAGAPPPQPTMRTGGGAAGAPGVAAPPANPTVPLLYAAPSHPSVAEVSVQGAGQAPPEGAQVGSRSSGDSRVDDAKSVAAARSAALPPDIAFQGQGAPGAFDFEAFYAQLEETEQLLARRPHVSAVPRLHMGGIAPPDAAVLPGLSGDLEGYGVQDGIESIAASAPGISPPAPGRWSLQQGGSAAAAAGAPRPAASPLVPPQPMPAHPAARGPLAAGSAPPNRHTAPAAAGGSMFKSVEDDLYDQAVDSGRSLQYVKDGMDDIAARIAAEYKVWSAKASAQSKVATDPDAKRDLAATANCLDSLAGLRRHAVLSYLPLASYVLIGTSCRMKVIAGTNFKKRDEAAAKGAELANFLACNLPKWKRAFTIASTHLEANLELGDLLVEGCFRRFDRMARWLRAEGVAVPSHLSGAAQAAEGEPYRTPELSQQSVARVRQRFDRIMAHTKDGHVRAACERVHGYLAELGGADWESCFWRLCADDLTTDWPMKMEHLAEALGAPNLAGLDRLLHNISCRLSCEALATPTTVFLYQREWSSSTSLHRTAARFSRGVQRAAERAAQFKQVLATAATRMLPPKAAQEVQRAAGEVDAILQVLAYLANVTGFSGSCAPSLAAAGAVDMAVAHTKSVTNQVAQLGSSLQGLKRDSKESNDKMEKCLEEMGKTMKESLQQVKAALERPAQEAKQVEEPAGPPEPLMAQIASLSTTVQQIAVAVQQIQIDQTQMQQLPQAPRGASAWAGSRPPEGPSASTIPTFAAFGGTQAAPGSWQAGSVPSAYQAHSLSIAPATAGPPGVPGMTAGRIAGIGSGGGGASSRYVQQEQRPANLHATAGQMAGSISTGAGCGSGSYSGWRREEEREPRDFQYSWDFQASPDARPLRRMSSVMGAEAARQAAQGGGAATPKGFASKHNNAYAAKEHERR